MRRRRIVRSRSGIAIAGSIGLAAVAGFAAGVLFMQQSGSIGGAIGKLHRPRRGGDTADGTPPDSVYEMDSAFYDHSPYGSEEDELEDDPDDDVSASTLEERVILAFLNDPILAEAALEVVGDGEGVVRLRGSVDDPTVSRHAGIIAAGVPGVVGVSNNVRLRRASRA